MSDLIVPVVLTIFIWWFATGAILALDGLRGVSLRRGMIVASIMLILAFFFAADCAKFETVAASYGGFLCGLVAWGWIEFAFLTGVLTGPNRCICPSGAGVSLRLRMAIGAILHHEMALVVVAGVLAALCWSQPNPMALHTFLLLWAMRQSAKLNLFLGVRNFSESFLPDHLTHLVSFFRRARMNALFPVSVTAATLLTVWFFHIALKLDSVPFEVAGFALLGTLAALAVIEHWFLVLPIPFEVLWGWGSRLRSRLIARAASL